MPGTVGDMPELHDALAAYERAITGQGFELFDSVRRGRPVAEITERLIEADIDPVDDVVDWFAFTDGRRSAPDNGPHLFGLFSDVDIVSLDDALAERERRLDPDFLIASGFDAEQVRELSQADLLVPFSPSWMPISHGKQTCVIETDRNVARFRQLTALWNDELEPRIMAASAAEWIERLTRAVPSGSIRATPAPTAGGVATAFFAPGTTEMTKARVRRLQSLVDNPFLARCVGIRLVHAAPGSLRGNSDLELRQTEIVEQMLREIGFSELRYERVAVDPDVDHVHAIDIFGLTDS